MKTAERIIYTFLPLFLFTQTVSADPVLIDFDDIPIGTDLVNGQYGWYDWDTGFSGGQSVVMSDAGSPSSGGTGASGLVSRGPDSIQSAFEEAGNVRMEWVVELRGVGPSNNRGPHFMIGRDLDGDGVLENANSAPALEGFEGLVEFLVNYDQLRIRHGIHDASGVRVLGDQVQYIEFDPTSTDLHCVVDFYRVNDHEMELEINVSGNSGVLVQEHVQIDFVGPHLWDQIDGVIIRTDNCCSTVDNIVFTPESGHCLADLTGDGQLDFFDVSGFLVLFQLNNPLADFTGDGQLDFFDVSRFLTEYAAGCP